MDLGALWARSVIVGCMAFFLGIAGHVSADGLLPNPLVLVALLLFAVFGSAPLLARQVRSPTMLLLLVGGQAGVHLVLTMTAGHRGDPGPTAGPAAHVATPSSAGLPTVDGHRVGSLLEAYQPSAGGAGGGSGSSFGIPIGHLLNDLTAHGSMMAAHLAAAAVVALWLAYGEHLLWSLVNLLGRTLTLALQLNSPVIAPDVRLRRMPVADVPALAWSRWLARPHSRRGPPLPA